MLRSSRRSLFLLLPLQHQPTTRIVTRFKPRYNTTTTTSEAERAATNKAREEALTKITFEDEASPRSFSSVAASVLLLAAAGFAGYMAYNELFPGITSPTSVFANAFDVVRNHSEVVARLGTPVNGYGRDLGGSREGRRNFYDHDQYVDDDGTWRTRIKFNLEGPNGKAVVYAEQKAGSSSKEFTYLIMEHVMRGRRDAIALQDNRTALTTEELQEKLANRLTNAGAVIMGKTTCQWTKKQLEEFGEFKDKIKVVMCDLPENQSTCTNANLKGYPTWRVKDQNVPAGFKTLEELQALARVL